MIETDRVVEIVFPKYGSAYHIGGHLVLTCKHLFPEDEDVCRVRSKRTDREFNAKVVWRSSTSDIALVELLDGNKLYEPILFGKIPQSKFGESIPCEFFGWPEWGNTYDSENERVAEIIHAKGEIRLAEVLSSGLHRLRVEENSIPPVKSEGNSPWQGCSGAAIVYGNCIIAVQSQHLRGENFSYLGVVSLSTIDIDGEWRSLLRKNGINPEFIEVQVDGVQSRKSKRVQSPIKSKVSSSLKLKSQMVKMLYSLDYGRQNLDFVERLKVNPKAAAFVLKAPCTYTRRWLVYRLTQQVPNHWDAIRLTFKPMPYLTEKDLWQNLASGLSADILPSCDSIIQYLCDHILSKPVIIWIWDMDNTQDTDNIHCNFEELIFSQFWARLNEALSLQDSKRNRDSRVVLFVTKGTDMVSEPRDMEDRPFYTPSIPLPLSPLLSISQDDVEEWLSQLSIKERERPQKERALLLNKLRDVPYQRGGVPGGVINQLCTDAGFLKGVSELDSMWRDAS